MTDYARVEVDELMRHDVCQLVRLAIAEDLDRAVDWTTVCLIAPESRGGCQIVSRQAGVVAGLAVLPWIIEEFQADIELELLATDEDRMRAGSVLATLRGNVRDLLTSERVILNLISRTCGIATLTRRYVDEISGTRAYLYDTRKTTPGWRRLEKYAVRCGGGRNHRAGLYDGFLIKDNHLALGGDGSRPLDIAAATERAMRWRSSRVENMVAPGIIEVEVDSLAQLEQVLPVGPDIVLVDNFSIADMVTAVSMRDRMAPTVELEASGNVRIDTIDAIARTGVNRISCGALTHQATSLDLGLDWFDSFAAEHFAT
jgi:nicotinate-nucleotide pyrophosphorylase (carboxylating)